MAICSSSVVLPALGGATIRPACPFADGRQQIHRAHGGVAAAAPRWKRSVGSSATSWLKGVAGAVAAAPGRDRGDTGQLAAGPALHDRSGHGGPFDEGVFLQEAARYADLASSSLHRRLHRVDQHRAVGPRFRIPLAISVIGGVSGHARLRMASVASCVAKMSQVMS